MEQGNKIKVAIIEDDETIRKRIYIPHKQPDKYEVVNLCKTPSRQWVKYKAMPLT